METKHQISIESLPSIVWRHILYSHHDANFIAANGGRGYKAMLKPFFRCKIASKKLNLLINDQFFFETLQGSTWSMQYYFYINSVENNPKSQLIRLFVRWN
jgi:hypothetical protein